MRLRESPKSCTCASLLKETGQLNDDGDKVRFLGRNLERSGETMACLRDRESQDHLLKECRVEKSSRRAVGGLQ